MGCPEKREKLQKNPGGSFALIVVKDVESGANSIYSILRKG